MKINLIKLGFHEIHHFFKVFLLANITSRAAILEGRVQEGFVLKLLPVSYTLLCSCQEILATTEFCQ